MGSKDTAESGHLEFVLKAMVLNFSCVTWNEV